LSITDIPLDMPCNTGTFGDFIMANSDFLLFAYYWFEKDFCI
jgi:hypothetical protein